MAASSERDWATALSDDPLRPSFFEMVAQDALVKGLRPAFGHVVTVLARWAPRWLGSLPPYRFELYYGLIYLLEAHYLARHDSTFGESFYMLRRVRNTPAGGRADLAPRDRAAALFFSAVVPYLRHRLERSYEALRSPVDEDGEPNAEFYEPGSAQELARPFWSRWWRTVLFRSFPWVDSAWELVVFGYQVRYMFGFSRYFSPALQALGQETLRMTAEDLRSAEERNPAANSAQHAEFQRLWLAVAAAASGMGSTGGRVAALLLVVHAAREVVARGADLLAEYAKEGLLLALALFKFIEWWYSDENRMHPASKLPVPPAPPPAERAPGGVVPPADSTTCPLCQRPRTNPTCTPAGFVYCYPCIFPSVQEHGRCPVSLMPCGVNQLRRLYEN